MNISRRKLLQAGGLGVGSLFVLDLVPRIAAADEVWNDQAFSGKTLDDVVKSLGGSSVQQSTDITITAPDIAENGAVVPITVASTLPGTQSIAILVEKNPNALSADFTLPAGTDAYVSTRVKMAETCNVCALVRNGSGFFYSRKEVKVTLGGCGG